MRRPGDLPEGGNERLKNMEQAILKPQNLPEELCLLADSPPAQGHPSISKLCTTRYVSDPLPGRILEAIRTNTQWKEITIVEYTEKAEQVWYRGKRYVPEDEELWLRLIQKHHNTALP